MTIKECVKKYTVYLKNITHIPAKEVEILIMHLLDKNVIWLHLNYDKAFTKELELEKLVKKRATNFPLEYIIKKASFYGEQFFTDEDVLIPRPETELLVENAFEILKNVKNQEKAIKVLEIGTGSGIISVMLAQLLKDNEAIIDNELLSAQGKHVDMGGYYKPDEILTTKAMRPSETFNKSLESLNR